MKKLSATLAALVLVGGMVLGSSVVAPAAGMRPQAERAERRESHPVIHQAIRQLQQTRQLLEKRAAHDFKGHRTQAIQSIDQAIGQLRQALQADKK